MKQSAKRILSMVLCLAMLVGLFPAVTIGANAATGEVIDAAIFCSDVHGNSSVVSSAFAGIQSADSTFDPSTATFVGDTQMAASSVTSAAQSVYSDVACYYAYGNHDGEGDYGIEDVTGLLYSGDNYYIYAISQTSMASSNPDTTGFTSTVAGLDKTKPLFIASHLPLHDRRGDSNGAAAWYEAISAAAESMDIVFFWAHNHTGENDVDRAAFYVAKDGDETFTLENTSTVVTPNFTYMNAGFVGKDSSRGGVVSTVKIYSDALVFQDYTSSGEFTGEYSHNVEVAREFASTTDSGDGDTDTDSGTTTETKEVYVLVDTMTVGEDYLIANGNTGTVTLLGQSSGSAATTTAEVVTEGDYTYIETADSGYVWNATAHTNSSYSTYPRLINAETYAMYASSGSLAFSDSLTSTSGAVYTRYWTYSDGQLACVSTNSGSTTYYLTYSDGYSMTSTATDGIYIYEKQTIATEVEITLSSIAVTTAPATTTYNVGDTFSSEGLVITATYSDGSTAAVTGYTLSDVDMTTAGTKTVTVTYTEDDVTKTVTFDITVNEVISETATPTALEVTGAKTEYTLGESLSTAGMVVTATYDDNGATKTAVVTDYTVSEVDMTTEGEKTVTVSYTYNDVTVNDTFTITVTEADSNEVTLGGSVTTTKTVYVLTSSITSGTAYLIANSNSAGSAYVVANNSGSVAATSVTVKTDSTIGTYIELDDATDELWTVGSGYTFKNGSYYLYPRTRNNGSLELNTNSRNWSYSNNRLCYDNEYYLYYSNGWDVSTTQNSVYFYVPTEVEIITSAEVKYTMRAEDLKQVVDTTNNDTLSGQIDFCLQGNGADLTTLPSGGSYSFTVLSDESGIISGDIASDGSFTFSGTTGTAKVKVAYTWTVDGVEYTVYNNITIEAADPYYTLDLYKASVTYTEETDLTEFVDGTIYYTMNEDGTYTQVASDAAFDSSVTYYTLSYTKSDEITAPIAIKGIEAGDRYGVWAVVTYYDGTTESGTDMGTVGDDIEWTSSDETIATVDKNTGIITFTGKEGTVNITATYKNGNKPSDTITISVTQSQYSVPADGTSDFPEYPNEGAIRYDKTATAVGNFSETGIAMVELSMTGVPYSTGSEIDVVVMLDMTGSMTDDSMAAAEAAAKAFADQIIKNEDGTYNSNRISVQIFNKNGVTELWSLSAVTADTYSSLVTAIESASDNQASGGTPYSTALSGCKDILDAARTDGTGNNRQQFCVFVSDGTPTSYTDVDGGSDTTKKEYYSSAMQEDGVTVYGVYTSAAAGSSSSGGGSVNDTEEGTAIMQNVASSDDKVYVVEDYTDTSALTGVFTDIAMDILQAATDVTVEDQITDEYTMIFDIPEGSKDITGVTNDFYIEFLKYTLDSTTHERVDSDSDGDTYDDATSVTKLYLGTSNGTYYAASDASGTAYDAPVFAQTAIGDKGTLYYWTTDPSYASKAAVTYTNDDGTYYFIPYGMEAEEDGTAPDGWYNMTSGGYAYGTVDSTTNMSTNLVIATPYFVYNANVNNKQMLYWTVDKLDTAEYALRYFLYLDDSATEVGTANETDAGTYPTNDHAYITYTNFKGNDCQQKFPVPQLTWSGAQVSYVFYLVNAQGQPINKSGQVVDFANAVFVTDVYTTAVVWNKGEDGVVTGDSNLSIDWLADELLPDDYMVYDVEAGYELHVYGSHTGETIFDYFIIEGSEAADISSSLNSRLELSTTASTVSVETTKVYNTKAGVKYDDYGTYTSEATDSINDETVLTGFDFANTTVAFAVVWQPKLVPDTVVVDFGLDVLINVVQNDILQNTVTGIGLGNEAYGTTAMNTGVSTTSKLGTAALTTSDGSTISIENENQIRFSQNDMTFTEPIEFYYESPVAFYENSEQKTGYMYSKVTVIPATTIYYEDDFLTLTSYTKGEDGTFVEDAASQWYTDGTTVDATQAQDRPGAAQISADLDADNNYGYDAAYESVSTHSMGSAAKINVDASTRGEATFTFYGTGFDVIGMSSNMTGTLIVQLYSGASATGTAAQSLVVDTFYGYTQDENGEWVVSVNDPNALYQVPVMKMSGLTYGQYTVKIIAGYNSYFENVEGSTDYDLYLDAIRIYDPTGNLNDDANDAYVADGEGWPQYIELRNNIITAEGVTIAEDGTVTFPSDTAMAGAIFIDSNDDNTSIVDYVSYGPNNELYLDEGQSVSFALDRTYASIIADVQIAMKLGNGSSVTYEIYNAATDGTKSNTITGTLTTATDLYYSIKDLASGTIVISNTSGGILSITNIKVTYTQDPYGTSASSEEDLDSGIMTTSLYVDEEVATAAVMSLRSAPVIEEEVPETTVPEETEPEVTEPETTVPEETEPEVTEPETTVPEETEPEEDNSEEAIIEEVIETVKEIIKSLFGKLFG